MTETRGSLHIVCPHCHAVNRVDAARIESAPTCGRCKQRLFDGKPAMLDEGSFDKQIARNHIPVVVDFWAPWCGPCRLMAPAFEGAAAELEPKARLAKLNTEEAQGIAARHNIRSIPTLVVFRHGREIARRSGAMQRAQLVQWVRSVVG